MGSEVLINNMKTEEARIITHLNKILKSSKKRMKKRSHNKIDGKREHIRKLINFSST